MFIRLAVPALFALLANPSLGQTAPGTFSGDAELGASVASGNTNVDTLSVRVDLDYQRGRWAHVWFGNVYYAEQDDETTADRYTLGYKPRYLLSRKNYLFGLLRYDSDEFAGFDAQATEIAGIGRKVVDNDTHSLNLEVGVGARQSDYVSSPATSDLDDDEFVTFLAGFYDLAITPNARFTQDVRVEVGSENTFVESVTGLGFNLALGVSARMSYSVRHNSDVEGAAGTNTDTMLGVSLLYSF